MYHYERPYTLDQIREIYGDETYLRLKNDPVHRFRAETGIEVIHREPTKDEFNRIVRNFQSMPIDMIMKSNEFSRKMFGKSNGERIEEIERTYPEFGHEFSPGDRVRVREGIRCRQSGKSGTIVDTPVGCDDETEQGRKLYYIKFDREDLGIMGFDALDIIREEEMQDEEFVVEEDEQNITDLGNVLRLEESPRQKELCWGDPGFVLVHKKSNPEFDSEKPYLAVMTRNNRWQLHFENFAQLTDKAQLSELYDVLAPSCKKYGVKEIHACGGCTPGGLSGISKLQNYGFKKEFDDDFGAYFRHELIYWGGDYIDPKRFDDWVSGGNHDNEFWVRTPDNKFISPTEYDGELSQDNTQPRHFKMVLTETLNEDGEGAACAAGDASIGSAPIGSVASVLTGGKPAYDYINRGEPILGPGDFVMPGGYKGRTKKNKKKFPINKQFGFDIMKRINENTKVTLTVSQIKQLIKEADETETPVEEDPFVIQDGCLKGYRGHDRNVVIPDGVTTIGKWVFHYCRMRSVVIPEGVTTIEEYAFEDCPNLAFVTLPSTLERIGNSAFYRCKKLRDVILPEGLKSIGISAFDRCESLEKIVLPNSLVELQNCAFMDCKNLKDVQGPAELLDDVIKSKKLHFSGTPYGQNIHLQQFKKRDNSELDIAIDSIVDEMIANNVVTPVTVTKGRKFQGNCYAVSSRTVSNGGYVNSGVRPREYYDVNDAWDPVGKTLVTFNGELPYHNDRTGETYEHDGIKVWEPSEEEMHAALWDYVYTVTRNCLKRCGDDQKYRFFYLRKVLSLSNDAAQSLADALAKDTVNENTKVILTMNQLKKLIKEGS